MTITCPDLEDFLDVIAGLVQRGLTFRARQRELTIELLGGF
jgi:hypothetical protein